MECNITVSEEVSGVKNSLLFSVQLHPALESNASYSHRRATVLHPVHRKVDSGNFPYGFVPMSPLGKR